ncbi:MAG: rhomboid family intramembrane serine protease [Sphaerochaetaceae bacterium]|nr:rhomboid family intramembrane serine protease [Sphaerochaetaceae bacterium]
MKQSFIHRKFRYSYTQVTIKLIIAHVVIFLFTMVSSRLATYLAMIPGAVLYNHWYWQFVTYMFVHGGIGHLFFNMFGLWVFGLPVERQLGSREFLLFYLLTGTLSGIFSFLAYLIAGVNVVLVGASGAIFAVLFAFAVFYPHARIFLFGIVPMRAPVMVLLYAAIELFNQVTGTVGGVAHLTHLAGFAFAYLYMLFRLNIHPMDVFRRL